MGSLDELDFRRLIKLEEKYRSTNNVTGIRAEYIYNEVNRDSLSLGLILDSLKNFATNLKDMVLTDLAMVSIVHGNLDRASEILCRVDFRTSGGYMMKNVLGGQYTEVTADVIDRATKLYRESSWFWRNCFRYLSLMTKSSNSLLHQGLLSRDIGARRSTELDWFGYLENSLYGIKPNGVASSHV